MTDTSSEAAQIARSPRIAARTLHAVGHFHLDPLWLWDKSDGLERFRSSVRAALDLMDLNLELTVAASSAALYAYLLRVDGELFDRVSEEVQAGRWQPVGGMWVEPDEHVPGGEAYVRQLLLGQEFFARHFGRIARVAWSPDSFGRYAGLPRMLAGSGLQYFIFKRPERHQKTLPEVFWWAAADGSQVLTYHIHEYLTFGPSLPRLARRVARDLREPQLDGLLLFGVGNHGGGPTQANIDQIHELQNDPSLPPIRFSTPGVFFERLLASGNPIPMVLDHLDYFSGGGYFTHAELKSAFRRTENLLVTAEIAASTRGAEYPSGAMERAWQQLAFNQFHDTAAGTCIPEVYPAVLDELAESRSIARDVTLESLHALANQIDIPFMTGAQPLVIFNPNGHDVRQFVIVNVPLSEVPPLARDLTETHDLIGPNGEKVPMQSIRARSFPAYRLGFLAEVPALGYTTYTLVPRKEREDVSPLQDLPAEEWRLENDRFRLTVGEQGAITGLFDKVHELEVFGGPASQPILFEDPGSAWGPRRFEQIRSDLIFRPVSIKRSQHGPLVSAIQVHSVLEHDGTPTGSTLMQEFRIYRDLEYIDLHIRLSWRERGTALKLAFPVFLKQYFEASVEIPYGSTLYPTDGVEVPGLSWVDLTGESEYTDAGRRWWHGVTVANTAKYSYSFSGSRNQVALYLMVARGNAYTFTPADAEGQGIDAAYEDEGNQEFEIRLFPHLEGWRDELTYRGALELNRPLIPIIESAHGGTRPASASFLTISHLNIVLGALKQAQDRQSLVLRLYEAHRELTEGVEITCFGHSFSADFFPSQIKTFRIPLGQGDVVETDLLERP